MSNLLKKFIFILLITLSTPAWGQTDILTYAYRAVNKQVVSLKEENRVLTAPALPKTLIVPSGYYTFQNKVYKLDKPGLYRFYRYNFNKEFRKLPGFDTYGGEQRIVFDGDIHALLSSISWLSMQGTADNILPQEELEEKSLHEKISVTCSVIGIFGHKILSRLNIESRLIQTATLDDWNTIDDGHLMLEVFFPEKKQWVLYDLSTKNYFKSKGSLLDAVDLYYAVKTGDYDLVPIANTGMVDPKSFGRYLFFMEEIISTPKQWYKHIVQAVMIGNNYMSETPLKKRKKIEDYYGGIVYYPVQSFKKKFYSK